MMNYTETTSHMLSNFEEVRKLIEEHNAWGVEFTKFEAQAGRKIERNKTIIINYRFGRSEMDFSSVYDLLQYIHKFYGTQ